jgi:DNA mismatch repair protein MutS
MHSARPGPANRSYGLQVAALAGLPGQVLSRARDYLGAMEVLPPTFAAHGPQADLFNHEHPVLRELKTLDPDALTPKQALEILYRLKNIPG